MLNSPTPTLLILGSDGERHTLSFYLGLTQQARAHTFLYEYHSNSTTASPPLWIAVVPRNQPLSSVLQAAAQRRLCVHNYSGQGIEGPGAFHTLQTWLGSMEAVHQRYNDEAMWSIQRILCSGGGSDYELEQALARSLEAYAEDQGRRSPCIPNWVEPLRRFKAEPAVPGVHPKCLSCLESRATLAFVDCGHQVMCDECACAFWSQAGGPRRKCLVCEKPIQHAPIHLFPSEPIPVNKDSPIA